MVQLTVPHPQCSISTFLQALRLLLMECHLGLQRKMLFCINLHCLICEKLQIMLNTLPCSRVNVDVCDEIMVDSSDDSSLQAPTISIVSKFCIEQKLKILYHLDVGSSALNSARLTCAQP